MRLYSQSRIYLCSDGDKHVCTSTLWSVAYRCVDIFGVLVTCVYLDLGWICECVTTLLWSYNYSIMKSVLAIAFWEKLSEDSKSVFREM